METTILPKNIKMNSIRQNFLLGMALVLVLFAGCKKEPPIDTLYDGGVFFLNQGGFQASNASVTFYNRETGETVQDIFATANNRPLGDILQSMTIVGDRAFLVVNNSKRIEVVNLNDFKSVGSVALSGSPRYLVADEALGKAWVTQQNPDQVTVIDLVSLSVKSSVTVGSSPEGILLHDQKIYVANSGWGFDSTVSIINGITDLVTQTLTVATGPSGFGLDLNGDLWVLCMGMEDWNNPANDIGGTLARVSLNGTPTVASSFAFAQYQHPSQISMSPAGDRLYFIDYTNGGKLFAMETNAASLPASPWSNKSFYGLGVDPQTGEVFATDPVDYASQGKIFRFSAAGVLMDSLAAGLVPGGVVFD